jgi:tetratricopeptide (TPR) repeat protein
MVALAASRPNPKLLASMAENERKNPRDHAFQYQLAKLHLAAGDRDGAYRYLQKALQNSPGTEEYAALLPGVIVSDAQVLKHFPILQKLSQKGRPSPELNLLLGRGYSAYKNRPRAAEAFAKVLSENPDLLDGMRQPILDLYAVKDYASAGALAERYVKKEGNDVEVRRIHADALFRGDAPPARQRAAIQGLVDLEPYNETWYLRLARLDLAAGDQAAALKHAREWVRIHPDDPEGLRFIEPLAAKAKDSDLYLGTLGSLARVDQAGAARHELRMAEHLVAIGKHSQAAEIMGKLAGSFQADAAFWHKYGSVQAKLGREGAGAALEKAYKLDPGNMEYARGFAASLTTDDAMRANLAVFKTLSRDGMTLKERARLARALYLSGDYRSSAKEWDGILGSDPSLADSTAGLAYLKSGQAAKAKPLLEKRLAEDPGDVLLLATLAELYGREGDQKKRMGAMERLVQEDHSHGDYVLRLAREKERAGAGAEALRYYSQWTFRHQDDANALLAFRNLAEKMKDTSSLMESLRYLTRLAGADRAHGFQLAELYHARSGEIKDVEALVKAHPDWGRGKLILAREYHAKGAWDQLAGLEHFLAAESRNRADLLEPLADLYARRNRTAEAHQAYHAWLSVRKKDREAFDKVYRYARDNKSPYLSPILRMGTESFPDDLALQAAYGASLGATRSGLDAYARLLAKDPKNVDAAAEAARIAKAVGDREATVKWAGSWARLDPDAENAWKLLAEALEPPRDDRERAALVDALEGLLRLQPGNGDLMIRLARLQEGLKRWDKAVALYRNLLYLSPKDRAARDKLISLMKARSTKEELAEVLKEIQGLDSSAHEAQYELAKLLVQRKDREKAYAYIVTALEQSPQNHVYQALLPKAIHNQEQILRHFKLMQEIAARPGTGRRDAANADLFLLLAKGYAVQGQWEASAAHWADAYRLAPKEVQGDREAVLAVYRGKDFPLAAELAERYFAGKPGFDKELQQIQILAYEKTRKDPAVIRKALKALLTFDKENAGGLVRLAELDLRAGDTAAAILNIRSCLMTSPDELRAYAMLLPLVEGRKKDLVTYVVVLEKLAQLDSSRRDVHLLRLADLYFDRRNYRQAARLFSEVADARPKDARVHYRLGQCRNQLGTGDLGVSCFRRAHELQPADVQYAHTYAQALQTPQEFKDNLRLYLFVNEKDPSLHERRGLALSHFHNGNMAASAKAWDKVVAEEKSLPGGEGGRYIPEAALAYLRTDQHAKARPMYQARLKREGGNLGLLDTVFAIHDRLGDEGGRTAALEALVSVDAGYKDYQLLLAKAKEKARDTAAAIEHYGQWTARNVSDAGALKSLHRLAQASRDTASLENALRLMVRIKGMDPEYHFQLAELQFKFTGETAELERLAKAHSSYHRGRVILAKEYYRRYDLQRMIPHEKALAAEALKDKDLLEPLAELYAYQDKRTPARQAFRDHLVHRQAALAAAAQGAGAASGAKARQTLRQAFDKAWIYSETGPSPHLPEILAIGNREFPGEPPIMHALAAALGKDAKALELYRGILAKDGNDLAALRLGSSLALALGRTRDAVPWLEKWASLDPSAAEPWKGLVESYEALKDKEKTAGALERLLGHDPANAALAFRAGQAHRAIGQDEKALEFLLRADELESARKGGQGKQAAVSGYASALMELLHSMADKQLAGGRPGRAVELYGLVLERDPRHRKANLHMGMWLAENKDFASAEPMLKLGIEQSPEPAPVLAKAWRLMGDCQAGFGKMPQALESYKRALALDAKDKAAAQARLDMARALNLEKELPAALADVVRLDSNNIEACAVLAEIRLKDADYPAAAALYRRITLAQAGEPSAWSRYGEALEGAKREAEAMAAWQKAWELGDRTPYMLQGLARMHRDKGTLEKAEGVLEELAAQQPENDEAAAWLAEIALRKGRLTRAEEMYAQAHQGAPEKIAYVEGLGEVFLRRGDAESSHELLEPQRARLTPAGRVTLADALRAMGKPEASLALYKEASAKAPSARAAAGHAEALLDRNRAQEARRLLETSGFEKDARARLALGKALLALKERVKAERVLAALVKEEPENAVHHQALAMAQYDQRNFSDARKGFRKALELDPALALSAYHAGLILLASGQPQEARGYFYELAQRVPRPDRALGLRGLGEAALAERKPAEATEYLVQAAEVHPVPGVMAQLSRINLELGRMKDAEEWAQRSLEADQDYPEGVAALAEVMLSQGQKEEARDFLKEAIARNPRACETHLALSKVLVAMENYTGAASNTRQVLAFCPEEPMSYYYAGVAADRAYQKKEAREFFKEYRKLGGDQAALPKGY